MKRKVIYIDEDLHWWMKEVAAKKRMTLLALAEELLRKGLKEMRNKED